MTRRMFAGVRTPVGFVNFFDQIMPLEKAKKRLFLKGASGSGKSTFMKTIAAGFEAAGFDTECFHCANDVGSLDSVAVNEKGFCIYDATAPHARDPELPAAIDKIIDFADFLDEQKIHRHTDEIKMLLKSKRLLYENTNCYFAAIGNIYSAEIKTYEAAFIKPAFRELALKWSGILNSPDFQRNGIDRKLFLNAVTPDGIISFADTIIEGFKVYGLYAEAGAGTEIFLTEIKDSANARGLNTESYYCPIEPTKPKHLLLPEERTAFVTVDGRYGYKGNINEKIDLGCCFDEKRLNYTLSIINAGAEQRVELLNNLLDFTVDSMKNARELHIKIEEIFMGAMDFDKVNDITEKVLRELLL